MQASRMMRKYRMVLLYCRVCYYQIRNKEDGASFSNVQFVCVSIYLYIYIYSILTVVHCLSDPHSDAIIEVIVEYFTSKCVTGVTDGALTEP